MRADIVEMARAVIAELTAQGLTIATAESCTGGLIAGALTEIPGSSEAVYGGFVTYANAAKMAMIGVPESMLARYGAVSERVARAMAEGARRTAGTDVAVAVTGVAGPSGGSELKPVGLVHFACTTAAGTKHIERRFGSIGRSAIREASVLAALDLVRDCLPG